MTPFLSGSCLENGEHLFQEQVKLFIDQGAHGEGRREEGVALLQVPVFHPAGAGQYYGRWPVS